MRRLICVLAGSLLIAGCGGGIDSSLLATAVQQTENAGGAEIAFQLEMEAPGLSQPIVMTGGGVEDAKNRRGQLTFDMSAMAQLPGVGSVCGSGCDMTVVSDGSTVYVRSPLAASALGGREWMKVDIERFGSAMGVPTGGSGFQSAGEQLRMLGAADGDLTNEGRDQIRGESATHYSLHVSVPGADDVPVDVWIDDQDRVRRVEVEQSSEQGGIKVGVHMTMEYVRFGVPVDIDLPSEDDVFDATGLALQQLNQAQP